MPLSTGQFFQQYPGYLEEFNRYKQETNQPNADPTQFLANIARSDPSNPVFADLSPAITTAGGDPNTESYQQGTQQGGFQSTGGSTQAVTTGQTQVGQQTQTGQTQQTGTQGVVDTLGFGSLLQGQAGAAQAADAARTGFLTDLVQSGGAGFNQQVEQATNRALSGPGMIGTGNAAKGRVAGAVVGDVARNNAGQRLQAAQQLAGPTALTNLVQAGNPYLGQTTSQAGTNTTVADSTQNATGFQNLVGTENQTGTSTASTEQSGFGEQPTQQGGCYVSSICAIRMNRIGKRVIRRAVRYKARHRRFRYMIWGYSLYGPLFARWIGRSDLRVRVASPICRAILYQELRWSGRRLPWKPLPAFLHAVFHHGSALIGWCSGRRYVTACSTDLKAEMAEHGLLFKENY